MNEPLTSHFYNSLHEIQSIDFVLNDLHLYLDTHPADASALAQFEQFLRRRHVLVEPFEKKYGPLIAGTTETTTRTSWPWAEGPWPWQV